jgi:hypothetical protein
MLRQSEDGLPDFTTVLCTLHVAEGPTAKLLCGPSVRIPMPEVRSIWLGDKAPARTSALFNFSASCTFTKHVYLFMKTERFR